MMKSFGKLLRSYIAESGYTIYGIAKRAGINRSTLQKALSEDQPPSFELIEKLLPLLKLTPLEKNEMMAFFEIKEMGNPLYAQRKYVKEVLGEILSARFEDFNRPAQVNDCLLSESKQEYSDSPMEQALTESAAGYNPLGIYPHSLCIDETNTKPCHGYYHVIQLFIKFLKQECMKKRPVMLLNAPANSDLFSHIFTYGTTYIDNWALLYVRHLTCFSKKEDGAACSFFNLDCLSNILPLVVTRGFMYEISYYYSNCPLTDTARSAFPYYAIFTDAVFLLSADLNTAIPFRDKSMVDYFKNLFDLALKNTVPLVTDCSSPQEALIHLIKLDKNNSALFSLEYQPCLMAYLNEKTVKHYLNPNILEFDSTFNIILTRVKQLKHLHSRTCIFTKAGLEDFTQSGYLAGFPSDFFIPLQIKDRISLLKQLYEEVASDQYQHRMVNPLILPIAEHLSCVLHQDLGIDFGAFFIDSGSYLCAHTAEINLLDIFKDFFQFLKTSSYVYSKKDTLDRIADCIADLAYS